MPIEIAPVCIVDDNGMVTVLIPTGLQSLSVTMGMIVVTERPRERRMPSPGA
ncbi:hypothetical protein [Actinoallomurus soli]|uniref:hypothetical protein n=1 Tax=Actinoallomurus soli TaxID=2952535 RepID=UPI002093FBA8|nr:hypothetical protein [Actinoallomurus soli]MCO5969441.1 hypothetical protein [Actinoallomurus soli]